MGLFGDSLIHLMEKKVNKQTLSAGFISNMSTHRQYFPDEEDKTGAARALMRLQDTYQLDSEAFSKGKLPGKQRVCTEYFKKCEYVEGCRVVFVHL